jgi:hypothetical protein
MALVAVRKKDTLTTFNRRDFGNAPAWFGVELLLPREAIARIIQ